MRISITCAVLCYLFRKWHQLDQCKSGEVSVSMFFEVRPQVGVVEDMARKESPASSPNNVPTKPASVASSHGDLKGLGNGKKI